MWVQNKSPPWGPGCKKEPRQDSRPLHPKVLSCLLRHEEGVRHKWLSKGHRKQGKASSWSQWKTISNSDNSNSRYHLLKLLFLLSQILYMHYFTSSYITHTLYPLKNAIISGFTSVLQMKNQGWERLHHLTRVIRLQNSRVRIWTQHWLPPKPMIFLFFGHNTILPPWYNCRVGPAIRYLWSDRQVSGLQSLTETLKLATEVYVNIGNMWYCRVWGRRAGGHREAGYNQVYSSKLNPTLYFWCIYQDPHAGESSIWSITCCKPGSEFFLSCFTESPGSLITDPQVSPHRRAAAGQAAVTHRWPSSLTLQMSRAGSLCSST